MARTWILTVASALPATPPTPRPQGIGTHASRTEGTGQDEAYLQRHLPPGIKGLKEKIIVIILLATDTQQCGQVI